MKRYLCVRFGPIEIWWDQHDLNLRPADYARPYLLVTDVITYAAAFLFSLQIADERCCNRCVPRRNASSMISLLPRSQSTVSFTSASFHPVAVFTS